MSTTFRVGVSGILIVTPMLVMDWEGFRDSQGAAEMLIWFIGLFAIGFWVVWFGYALIRSSKS